MSSACSGLDVKTLRETREYYNQLFDSTLGWYNKFVHPLIYQLLCLMGVLANVCVVVVLLRRQMRKNPFNLFLIATAICDVTLMASYFIYKQVEMCHPWYFEYAWIVFTYSYAVLSVYVHSASLWITVNMAVLRYLVLRNSASSSTSMPNLNSYKAASFAIGAALLISLIGSAPNMLRYEIRDNGMSEVPATCVSNRSAYRFHYTADQLVHAYTLGQPTFWSCSWERFSFWTAGLMLKLIPCLLLTIFMTLLVRMLMEARERRLRLCQRSTKMSGGQASESTKASQSEKFASTVQQCHPAFSTVSSTANNSTTAKSVGGAVQVPATTTTAVAANLPQQQQPAAVKTPSAASAERTTAMLTIIVAVFLITELPQGILVMTIGVQPQLHNLIDLLSLLNSSVNFILYSTMSNLFRNEFLQTFGQLCCCIGCCRIRRTTTDDAQRQRRLRAYWAFLNDFFCGTSSSQKSRLSTRTARERLSGGGRMMNGASTTGTTFMLPSATVTGSAVAYPPPTITTTSTITTQNHHDQMEPIIVPLNIDQALTNGATLQSNGTTYNTCNSMADKKCTVGAKKANSIKTYSNNNNKIDAKTPLIRVANRRDTVELEFDESGETILC